MLIDYIGANSEYSTNNNIKGRVPDKLLMQPSLVGKKTIKDGCSLAKQSLVIGQLP